MSRFTKKPKPTKIATVIGTGTKIIGNIEFAGGLHVDGTIVGNVTADQGDDSALTLSENGTIEGEVRVPNMVINGKVLGDVYGSHNVELAPNAKVTGTVYYHLLEMAMGAEVNGQLVHTAEQQPRRLGYDGGKEKAAEPAKDAKSGELPLSGQPRPEAARKPEPPKPN
jgi:cytoskeletal protein CcmA (bactofilin family)